MQEILRCQYVTTWDLQTLGSQLVIMPEISLITGEQVDFWVSWEDSGESKPEIGESAQGEAIGSVGHDRRR